MSSSFFKCERGNTLTEFALCLPILIGVVLISADLYNINRMRGVMEQVSHNVASILVNQQEWKVESFDHLVEQVVEYPLNGEYELIVSKVNVDRSMDWLPIQRGGKDGICTNQSNDNQYIGQMPEEDPDISNASFLVVQLCRYSDDLVMNSGLLGSKILESMSINRLLYHSIVLDQTLSDEVGVDYE